MDVEVGVAFRFMRVLVCAALARGCNDTLSGGHQFGLLVLGRSLVPLGSRQHLQKRANSRVHEVCLAARPGYGVGADA